MKQENKGYDQLIEAYEELLGKYEELEIRLECYKIWVSSIAKAIGKSTENTNIKFGKVADMIERLAKVVGV